MSQSTTIGAPISPEIRKIIERRKRHGGFLTDTEYVRWLIREDLKKAGLLGERMNEAKPDQQPAAERLQPTPSG